MGLYKFEFEFGPEAVLFYTAICGDGLLCKGEWEAVALLVSRCRRRKRPKCIFRATREAQLLHPREHGPLGEAALSACVPHAQPSQSNM
jgi:hypothetical protein